MIFRNITVLLYFWSNKSSLDERKRLVSKHLKTKSYRPQTLKQYVNIIKKQQHKPNWKPIDKHSVSKIHYLPSLLYTMFSV